MGRIIESLAAHAASARRSGLRLAPRAAPGAAAADAETLEQVRQDLGDCSRCSLCQKRNSLVFGRGSPRARVAFVGSAPTQTDDAEGRPFCGAEGDMLANIVTRVLNLSPPDVYLTHMVKCAPPGGRPPLAEEAAACRPFLVRQLAAVSPVIVCALGEAAARTLLNTEAPLAELRGSIHGADGFPVLVTHDLSFLLIHQDKKRETWDDLKLLMRDYGDRIA